MTPEPEIDYEPSVLGELAHIVLKFVGFAIALAIVVGWWIITP